MEILFFIGQALAIAAIGYIVAQAYEYAAKYGDSVTRKSAGFSTWAAGRSARQRTHEAAMRFSFVPESVGGAEDLGTAAREEPSLRDARERMGRARVDSAAATSRAA
jgi:hypothetical protein